MICLHSLDRNKLTVVLIVMCNHLLYKKLTVTMYGRVEVYLHLLYISVEHGGV